MWNKKKIHIFAGNLNPLYITTYRDDNCKLANHRHFHDSGLRAHNILLNVKYIMYHRRVDFRYQHKYSISMFVTFGICFEQHFDTRYLVFYNTSPPRMFLSLDLLWEYRIQHGANGPLYVTSSYSTWIFCRGVSGFATDCPCGVWCCGLTTCLLHVGPPFGNRILNNSRFDIMANESYFVCFDICNYICLDTSDHFSVLPS